MTSEILVFSFAAISNGAVALSFGFKWLLDGRRNYDLAWTAAMFCHALSIAAMTTRIATGTQFAAHAASILFWSFAALMTIGNLAFGGRKVPVLGLALAAAVIAAISISLHLSDSPNGFLIVSSVGALLYFWTGWELRRLPVIGRYAFGIFAARAALAVMRSLFIGTPFLIHYSIASFTMNFIVGITLLAGSLFQSRLLLLASRESLRRSNEALVAHEAELEESNRLLEEQALRLERLGSDYAAALQRAEQANRAKDSFIANMNHEFRTPLNAALGFTELIESEASRNGATRIAEYAGYAHDAGRAMLRNVDRILTFISLDTGERSLQERSFDPRRAVLREIEALSAFARQKGVSAVPDLAEAPSSWSGDEGAFRAIVDELLRNALRAAPSGSNVTVQVTGCDNQLALRIVDCGPGLSDKFLKTVGDLFNISEHVLSRGGAVQGVGLGLSIAARYARLMGGALTLERNQPTGTVARVLLSRGAEARAMIPIVVQQIA